MLRKIDGLHLPLASQRDLESILVRQVTRELDRLFPWQAGHAQEAAAVVLLIGQAVHLNDQVFTKLKLAALLQDIGRLMLLPHLQAGQGSLEPDAYLAI